MEFTEAIQTAPLSELLELRSQLDNEICKQRLTTREAGDLIEHIQMELGFSITDGCRKHKCVAVRGVIYMYLRDSMFFRWMEIAKLFRIDHSTVIHSHNKSVAFFKHKDAEFMIWYGEVMDIINNFRK